MVSNVFIHPEAGKEVETAIDYYHEISPQLSADLRIKFWGAVSEATRHYKLYQPIRGQYRKINLERFPYKIVFRLKDDTLIIMAFAHHKRKPNYWRKR